MANNGTPNTVGPVSSSVSKNATDFLSAIGIFREPLTLEGAVMEYQKRFGLPVNGLLDAATQKSISDVQEFFGEYAKQQQGQSAPSGPSVPPTGMQGGGSFGGGGGGGGGGGAMTAAPAPAAAGKDFTGDPEGYLRANYPDLLPYLQIPDLKNTLIQAAQNRWDPTEIMGHLQATDWWKNTAGPERDWIVRSLADPQSAALDMNNAMDTIRNEATKIGVNLSLGQVKSIADQALRSGWISKTGMGDSVALRYHIAVQMGSDNLNAGGQRAASQMDQLQREWGVDATPEERLNFERGIGLGNQTIDDFNSMLQKRAASAYAMNPTLANEIKNGVSPGKMFQPYADLASKELGVPTDQLNWKDPKWMTAINYTAPDGSVRPMNMDEWQKKIRTDPQYGWQHTSTADDLAARMNKMLLSTFGEVA